VPDCGDGAQERVMGFFVSLLFSVAFLFSLLFFVSLLFLIS
jgi:hypothetical protein